MDEISGMDDIIREFLVESNEALDQMDSDLVKLENEPECRELLASVFRAIHTIKGTSGVLGFPKVESVAHVGENLLSRMRDGQLRLNPQITTVLLAMVDALRTLLASIEGTGSEGDQNCSEVVGRIASCLDSGSDVCRFDSGDGRSKPNSVPMGEILVNSGVSSEAVAEALVQQSEGDPRHSGEILVARGDAKPETVLDALTMQAGGRNSTVSGNVRVDVGLLDRVMNLTGELVLARNQVLQFTASQQDPGLVSAAQRLNLITTELQESVMKTRMQPIGNVWNKFPRLLRDLAVSCGKRVRIELEGSETELDKTIIEAIKDPLTQTLANILDRMGVQIPASAVRVNNVASVFVTASLPPFARPGLRVDITVSSIGDAKSLEGGLLLLTPLHGADGSVYAAAQGPVVLGGYTAGLQGNSKQVNHPTVARIPQGGIVERGLAVDLSLLPRLSLLLADADFGVARDVAGVINSEFKKNVARAMDSRRIELDPEGLGRDALPSALARLEALQVPIHPRARVVVSERTGTVVIGSDVRLSAVSILHGNLSIEVSTDFKASQPAPFSQGETVVVPQPAVRAQESPARRIELSDGASVEQLVNGLQAIGATARDVVAILQAIKAAGALQAELEVI